jgi:hypothetical protein
VSTWVSSDHVVCTLLQQHSNISLIFLLGVTPFVEMWKKEISVFTSGSNYLGVAADLKSNVFEIQQSSKIAENKVVGSGEVSSRLELKTDSGSKKRTTAEVVNDAVEAANVHDRLVEKVR